jgi:hypothetical protein
MPPFLDHRNLCLLEHSSDKEKVQGHLIIDSATLGYVKNWHIVAAVKAVPLHTMQALRGR